MRGLNKAKYCNTKALCEHGYHIGTNKYSRLKVTKGEVSMEHQIDQIWELQLDSGGLLNYLQDKVNKVIYKISKVGKLIDNRPSGDNNGTVKLLDEVNKISDNLDYIKSHREKLLGRVETLLDRKNRPVEEKYQHLLGRINQISVTIEEQSRQELAQLAMNTEKAMKAYSTDMSEIRRRFEHIEARFKQLKTFIAPDVPDDIPVF